MARLAMCGWESGSADEGGELSMIPGTISAGNQVNSVVANPRTGTFAWRARAVAPASAGVTQKIFRFPITDTPPNEVWVRFGIGLLVSAADVTARTALFDFLDGSTVQCGLGVDRSIASPVPITLALFGGTRNNSILASNGVFSTTSRHTCIEMHYIAHPTSGTLTVWNDGVQLMNYSGRTIVSSSRITGVAIGPRQTMTGGYPDVNNIGADFDDFAINDTTGTRNNGRIGQGGIIALWPNADTADKDWARSAGSDNYALVNSVPPDDDATYVTATSVGDRDLYEFGNLTNVNSIDAIAISGRLKTTFGAGAPVGFAMRSGATTGDVGSHQAAGAWTTFTDVIEADPNTAAAWTLEAVNSVQAGFTIL